MRISQDILEEIASLGPVRLQEVWALKNNLVLELFSFKNKRLFLISNSHPEELTLHVQEEKPAGKKIQNPLVLILRKYAVGKTGEFSITKNNNLIFNINNSQNYKLYFNLNLNKPVTIFLINNNIIISSVEYNHELDFSHKIFNPKNNLDANFNQAKIYQEKINLKAIQEHEKQRILRIKKLEKLRKNLLADLEKFKLILERQHEAELLRLNLHNIKKGDKKITLIDYTLEPPQKKIIILDTKISPQAMLEKLFNNIKKAHRGINHIKSHLEKLDLEISCDFTQELKTKTKITKRLPYRIFISSDNIPIWVGKSARDNDILTLHHTKGKEWWFHVREGSGSHIVVKCSQDSLKPDTLIDAALLAVYYSSQKNNTSVEVTYTRIKNIKKPPKVAPGKVIITQEKSLFLRVDQNRLSKLILQNTKP